VIASRFITASITAKPKMNVQALDLAVHVLEEAAIVSWRNPILEVPFYEMTKEESNDAT